MTTKLLPGRHCRKRNRKGNQGIRILATLGLSALGLISTINTSIGSTGYDSPPISDSDRQTIARNRLVDWLYYSTHPLPDIALEQQHIEAVGEALKTSLSDQQSQFELHFNPLVDARPSTSDNVGQFQGDQWYVPGARNFCCVASQHQRLDALHDAGALRQDPLKRSIIAFSPRGILFWAECEDLLRQLNAEREVPQRICDRARQIRGYEEYKVRDPRTDRLVELYYSLARLKAEVLLTITPQAVCDAIPHQETLYQASFGWPSRLYQWDGVICASHTCFSDWHCNWPTRSPIEAARERAAHPRKGVFSRWSPPRDSQDPEDLRREAEARRSLDRNERLYQMYKASDTPELQCIRERIEAMWAEGVDWLTNPPQIFVRNEEIPVDVLGLEDPSQSGSAVTPDPILTAESFVPQPPFEWPQGESRLFSALPMPPIEEYMSPPSDPPFPSVLDPRETVTGSDHEEADAA